MKITVVGNILTALITAGSLAANGNEVTLIRFGAAPGFWPDHEGNADTDEPGLVELLKQQHHVGRLRIALAAEHFPQSDVVFLALNPAGRADITPWLAGHIDHQSQDCVVINQSAFPVGSAAAMERELTALRGPQNTGRLAVLAMPDFVADGRALESFQRPDRILLGADADWALPTVRELLKPFNRRRDSVMLMGTREAEFSKFAVNGMLATRISFMNEMALLAESMDVDVEKVRQGMGSDHRIGFDYLYPGCGFGGEYFTADVMHLADTLQRTGHGADLLDTVLKINERQKELLFRKLWRYYRCQLRGRVVALWGASFKPGTERINNAPALKLIEALLAQGASIRIHDPMALETLADWLGPESPVALCDDPYQAADQADALMLVTEWKDYWNPDWRRLREIMREPLLLDGRNVWDPERVNALGFQYYGVGRGVGRDVGTGKTPG